MEQLPASFITGSLERRPVSLATHSVNIWFASERAPNESATPARNDSYADDTGAPLVQPASSGSTHDKLTSRDPLCNGLRAFATRFSFCLSPASNGRDVPEWLIFLTSWLQVPERDHSPYCLSSPRARR